MRILEAIMQKAYKYDYIYCRLMWAILTVVLAWHLGDAIILLAILTVRLLDEWSLLSIVQRLMSCIYMYLML